MKSKLIYLLVLAFASCQHKESNTGDTLRPKMDSFQPGPTPLQEPEVSLDFKIISAESATGGYGYDVYRNGKLYIHQPVIPAIPGNRGFSTQEKAEKAAELVVFKIKNNMLPPTIEISELDSLHLLE